METDGRTGFVPEEYEFLRAAKMLGVAPWELEQVSVYWTNAALEYARVEAEAQASKEERAKKRRKPTRPA